MAETDLPARGNLGPQAPDSAESRQGKDDVAGTSAGSGTGLEGFGNIATTGTEDFGTGAGTGTGASGPGTAAGSSPNGTNAGAEVSAIGSGYGGPVTPGGPTGEPTAEQQARSTTLDGTIGRDATGTTEEVDEDGSSSREKLERRTAQQANPHVPEAGADTGSVRTPHGWHSEEPDDKVTETSMDSFPASDPPSYPGG